MSLPLNNDEIEKILQWLSSRAYFDTQRISQLERQVKALRIRFYALLFVTLLLSIVLSMVAARMTWHLRP